ncbi:hypothetical protein WR25_05476 [Diploscapter pachys]|uniref:glycerophosphocholine cholinephosphodiesterase n=1 Tax=Diploscapter pachys TaxID=2018661 RepID=A0A2A2LWV3_9BILA|nr:hypothetical protein WR25_05476 [Diploscapter pachys]
MSIQGQRVILIIADGLGSSIYRRFSHYNAFRTFEDEGIWSVRMKPVFPSLPLPNRHSLMTGLLPRRHGLIYDYVYNFKTGETFDNFTQRTDLIREWWAIEPLYELARRSGAKAAVYFFPECEVNWKNRPQACISEVGDLTNEKSLKTIIESTRKHDLVIVNHVKIREELAKVGMARAQEKTLKQVHSFEEALERIIGEVRIRIDLNLIVVSTHSLIDVPRKNIRFLDDYLPMELVNKTIGCGAFKQIQAKNGKTHQVYSQLKYHSPIPNISVYYTTHKAGNLPEWYEYKKSSTIPDLVLLAQPGYAIASREKQVPAYDKSLIPTAISGYNAEYPPGMGLFLAYGPG